MGRLEKYWLEVKFFGSKKTMIKLVLKNTESFILFQNTKPGTGKQEFPEMIGWIPWPQK